MKGYRPKLQTAARFDKLGTEQPYVQAREAKLDLNTADLKHLSRSDVRLLLEEAARKVFDDPVIEVQNVDLGAFVVVVRHQPETIRFRVQVVKET